MSLLTLLFLITHDRLFKVCLFRIVSFRAALFDIYAHENLTDNLSESIVDVVPCFCGNTFCTYEVILFGKVVQKILGHIFRELFLLKVLDHVIFINE